MMLATLLCLLACAVATDLRCRTVPNMLVAGGLAVALLLQLALPPGNGPLSADGGAVGLGAAAGGIAVGFAVFFPLYALRAMGAGDVKLMMMVGAFLGPVQSFGVALLTFIAGGLLAVALVLWQRSLAQFAENLRVMYYTTLVKASTGDGLRVDPLRHTAGRMPYALAIAAGTLSQLVLVRSGGWLLS